MSYSQLSRRKGIQLCYPFEERRLLKWRPPFLVQPKLDGVRCRAEPFVNAETARYLMLSSECNLIQSLPHITEALEEFLYAVANWLPPGRLPELDGELYIHGRAFEEIVSLTSRDTPNALSHTIEYHVFDLVDESKLQVERTSYLHNRLSQYIKPPLFLVPYKLAYDLDEVMAAYDYFVQEGYEGMVVRDILAPYVKRRSTQVMKFKPKKRDTYIITGYTQEIAEDGTPKDSLGALVCQSDEGETFNVGTGFTREMRNDLWFYPDDLIGKRVVISYQHTTSKRGVPRFPVFVELINEADNLRLERELDEYGPEVGKDK